MILFIAGTLTILLLSYFNLMFALWNAIIPFMIVWAMGFQNAFGRLYSKSVYAQTTVMTGNVTQLTLDLTKLLLKKNNDGVAIQSINKQISIVGIFLAGCIVGALVASNFGLWTVLFPALC